MCVGGEGPFSPDLEQEFQKHAVGTAPVAIRSVKRGANLRACHIVFVTSSASEQAAGIIENLKGSNVLTVGETKGFAERGGIINFQTEENKLRFEINLDATKQTPLTISSKVLALARIERDPPHP